MNDNKKLEVSRKIRYKNEQYKFKRSSWTKK